MILGIDWNKHFGKISFFSTLAWNNSYLTLHYKYTDIYSCYSNDLEEISCCLRKNKQTNEKKQSFCSKSLEVGELVLLPPRVEECLALPLTCCHDTAWEHILTWQVNNTSQYQPKVLPISSRAPMNRSDANEKAIYQHDKLRLFMF